MVYAKMGKLYLLLAVLVYLNLFDLISTLGWCQTHGFDQELNPLMHYLFSLSPMAGITFKILIILLFLIIMHYASHHCYQLVYAGTLFIVVIYSALLCWHIVGPVIAGL